MHFTGTLSQSQITLSFPVPLTVLPHRKANSGEQPGQAAAREHRAESVKTCLPLFTVGSGSDPPVQRDKAPLTCVYVHSRDKVKKVGGQLSLVGRNFLRLLHNILYFFYYFF